MCKSVMGVAEAWHQDRYICHNDYSASDSFTVIVEQRMPKVHSLPHLYDKVLSGEEGVL